MKATADRLVMALDVLRDLRHDFLLFETPPRCILLSLYQAQEIIEGRLCDIHRSTRRVKS